ncbi:MAG: OmpH family outer membrane protein [Verrucomicrobiota bacterium]
MKFTRSLSSLLLALLVASPLAAQTTAPAAAAPKQVSVSKVAWLDSRAFFNEEAGIKRLVRSVKELDLEFSGTQSELNLLQEKLRTIVGELQKLQAGGEANAQAAKDKQTEGLKLQQELQTKQQQAQQAFGQAQQQKQGPVMADIGKALQAYAKERDLGVLLDAAKLGDALLYTKEDLDVTADFIAYFNAANP